MGVFAIVLAAVVYYGAATFHFGADTMTTPISPSFTWVSFLLATKSSVRGEEIDLAHRVGEALPVAHATLHQLS